VKDAEAQATAAVIIAQMTPVATVTPISVGTPTMSMQDIGLTQLAYQQLLDREAETRKENALGTQAANEQAVKMQELRVQQAAIKATSDAAYLKAEEAAAAKTQVAYSNLMTAQKADAITAIVAETQAVQTQVAAQATAKFQPTADMWTTTAVVQEAEIKQGEVEKVNLAVKRQTSTNMLTAFGPWGFLFVLGYIGARGFQTYVKTRAHPRDEHGRTQTFQRELPDGGVVIVRPEQLETGIVKVTSDGNVIRYEAMDKQEQSDINRRNQITEAIAALPMPYARNAQGMMKSEFGGASTNPSVKILNDARALSPVLDEAEAKLVEE
jgi:hypothetical protein